MRYKAEITIMPLSESLNSMELNAMAKINEIGLSEIEKVRIGKHLILEIEAPTVEVAEKKVNDACQQSLVDLAAETYQYIIFKA